MRPALRVLLPALLLAMAGLPASAQQTPANPPPAIKKKDACFKANEVQAEAQVRTGIQLREILRRCAELDTVEGPAALKDWYSFDSANANQLKQAVQLRHAALLRIYPNLQSVTQWETDSAVATMKSVQVNDGVCKATYDVMARLKKEQWKGFQYYAKLQESLLAYEIPICRK